MYNMKKLALATIFLFLFALTHAQHVFNKGSVLFNVGIGAPVNYGYIPTLNFSADVGVIPTGDIGIVGFGGIAELQFADYDYYWNNSGFSEIKPIFILGPRAYWHLQVFESDKWDVYGGAGFGIAFDGYYSGGAYNSDVSFYGEGFVGGRMMMSENFGLFAETGWGTRSFLKFGITFGIGASTQ